MQRPGLDHRQRRVEHGALDDLDMPVQRRQPVEADQQRQHPQHGVEGEQHRLRPQRGLAHQPGHQVDQQPGHRRHDPVGDLDLEGQAGRHHQRHQAQQRQGRAVRADRAEDFETRAAHGGFSQFSELSRIQSRPASPLPGEPDEPQSFSCQLPLVAKVITFSIAFR